MVGAEKNNTRPGLSSPEAHNVVGRSWLDKLPESKVDTPWLTSCPAPLPWVQRHSLRGEEQADQSLNHSINQQPPPPSPLMARIHCNRIHQISCSLIIFQMITVAVQVLKARARTPHSAHFSPLPSEHLRPKAAGAGFFVCCSICLTHVTALIYAWDERAGGNARFPARLCVWEKRYNSFQGM